MLRNKNGAMCMAPLELCVVRDMPCLLSDDRLLWRLGTVSAITGWIVPAVCSGCACELKDLKS